MPTTVFTSVLKLMLKILILFLRLKVLKVPSGTCMES